MAAEDVMHVEWCIGRAVGDRAKSIIDHANSGVGYFIMEQGKQGAQTFCLYAFRRAADSPVPEHLTRVVDPFQQKKLDDRYNSRHGIDTRAKNQEVPYNPEAIQRIKDIFNKPKSTAK
jgi:hypothetical protein